MPTRTMQEIMKEEDKISPISVHGTIQRSSDDSQVSAILAEWVKRNGMEAAKDISDRTPSAEPRTRESPVIAEDPPVADVTIVTCDGGSIKAHKLILCLRSEVFSVMFMSQMSESTVNEVQVLDFPPHVVVAFIDYFYSNSIGDASLALCGYLYAMSRKYQATGLRHLCEERMLALLGPGTVFEILALGDLHGDDRLRHTALTYIAVSSTQLVGMPFFLEKMQQYMKGIQEPVSLWHVSRSRSDSALDRATSPVLPVGNPLRQLIQAIAGVGPAGTNESLIFSPAGCTCHTCRVHRSTAATFHEHAVLCEQRGRGSHAGSPAASVISVPPQLFDSPLSFVQSSLSNSAEKTMADGINSDEAKKSRSGSDEQKLKMSSRSSSEGQVEGEMEANAKRPRLEPSNA